MPGPSNPSSIEYLTRKKLASAMQAPPSQTKPRAPSRCSSPRGVGSTAERSGAEGAGGSGATTGTASTGGVAAIGGSGSTGSTGGATGSGAGATGCDGRCGM